jgi:hypothetical protein
LPDDEGRIAMKVIGIVLVVLGALGLGLPELRGASKRPVAFDAGGANVAANAQKAMPAVISGIAVTSGLILMASALKRT